MITRVLEPIMCPFDDVVKEVDEREPHEYVYGIEKLIEYGIDTTVGIVCCKKTNKMQDLVCSFCPRCCWI